MNRKKQKQEKYSLSGIVLPIKKSTLVKSLMDIYNREAELTPELVLDEARKESHPLHKCFEWNNKRAAEKYRLTQAGKIIRAVLVEKKIAGKMIAVRAFINIKTDVKGQLTQNLFSKGKSMYVTVDTAMNDDFLRVYTIDRALLELNSLIDKYENLKALAGLFRTIRRNIKHYKNKTKKKKRKAA